MSKRRPSTDTIDYKAEYERVQAELETARARWRALVEDIADEVWLCDASGKMTLLNMKSTIGLDEFSDRAYAEVLSDVEILAPDGRLRPAEDAPLLRSLRGEAVRGEEFMRHRRTGQRRHRWFSSAPVRDAGGAITGAIAIVHDITDARLAESRVVSLNQAMVRRAAELKAALDRHALELASMTRLHEVTTRLVRLDDLRHINEEILDAAIGIVSADKGAIQMLDDSGAMQVVAQSGFDPSVLEELNAAQAALLAGAERGRRLIVEDLTRDPRVRDTPPAGVLLHAGIRAIQLTPLAGRGGDLIGILSTHYTARRRPEEYGLRLLDMLARQATEIILRRRVEAALRDSEAAIRAFFDRAIVGAAQVGLDGRFISVNDRYCQITGYTREEMLSGLSPLDMTPPDEREGVGDRLMPFLRGEIPEYDIEHRHVRKDGGEIWIHVTAGMIRDSNGKPLRIAAIIEDITTRKRDEEALRQSRRELEVMNQTLEQRVAERTAEAEARTAQLRKLAGELTRTEQRERRRFAQMLHDHLQQLLVGAKFNASIIERRLTDPGARRHLQYVTDLLDQSIAASRTLTIELSPPILFEGKLIPALHWLARWMEENHGLHLTINANDEVFPLGEDMRILLFQSVRELVFNVVKHAGVSEAVINVTRLDSMLHIIIEDHGAGFDLASLDPGDFSGFGLLKVKERLNLLGGCFDVDSAPGTGTRVTLVAPLQHADAEAGAGGRPSEPSGKRIRVLIADDHALIRDGLSQVLQSDPGVEVVGTAADGQQAVEMAVDLNPDVVLMDVSMPKLSGIEATRRLRRTMHASIIGLSMHSETEMAARMREAGADAYIVKTAPPEEVLAAIRHAQRR